jgi:eukaryotic-like serine/threonine-protein kinase
LAEGGGKVQQARELKSFGKYRLIASLGAGGMAKVYLALMAGPAGFNKLLVIKVLREDLEQLFGASAYSVQMFWKEARLAARLSHPNIVQVHEVGEINQHYFIAMEYLDGQPYSVVLTRTRKLSVSLAEHARIVSEVARALHYSHTLRSYEGGSIGIVHRDVSPHNIFVTYDGQVKLLDFGVATTEDPDHVTRVGVIKGKLDYIAPEQLRGDPIDGRADIFALGAVLWEALSGHRFGGGRKVPDALKVQARLGSSERKLRELCPTLPEALLGIVERATALDPSDRFSDAAAFADALDSYIASVGERPSPQSLSAILTPLFETERAQMNEVINAQLQSLKSAPIAIDLEEGTGSLPLIQRESEQGLISYVPRGLHDSSASMHTQFSRAASSIPATVSSPPPRRRDTLLLLGGTVAAAAALALSWPPWGSSPRSEPLNAGSRDGEQATAPAAATAVATGGPRAPDSLPPHSAGERGSDTVAESVLLQINVEPPTASVTVDGAAVSVPFSGQFRKDASLHMVEATADGYRPLKQLVKFERDQTLALALGSGRAPAPAKRTQAATMLGESTTDRRAPAVVSNERAPAVPPRAQAPAVPPRAQAPAAARSALGPGADIELDQPAPGGDDIEQANPYRSQK